jgi:sensor c-di-GMP phosphodiesterase-like protein
VQHIELTKYYQTDELMAELVCSGYVVISAVPIATKKTVEFFSNTSLTEQQVVEQSINTKLLVEDVDNWINEYRQLFKGKKVGAMGDRNTCLVRMREFVKNNPHFSKEHILNATRRYIAEKSGNNYIYLRHADYFIKKSVVEDGKKLEVSDLERYCQETYQPITTTDTQWHGSLKIG